MLQHFVTTHGDHFLQAIRNVAQDLNMSLDGEIIIQNVSVKKVTPVQAYPKKLTPAKFEAWRMWHEDGHSIEKIAVCFILLMLSLFLLAAYFVGIYVSCCFLRSENCVL